MALERLAGTRRARTGLRPWQSEPAAVRCPCGQLKLTLPCPPPSPPVQSSKVHLTPVRPIRRREPGNSLEASALFRDPPQLQSPVGREDGHCPPCQALCPASSRAPESCDGEPFRKAAMSDEQAERIAKLLEEIRDGQRLQLERQAQALRRQEELHSLQRERLATLSQSPGKADDVLVKSAKVVASARVLVFMALPFALLLLGVLLWVIWARIAS